MLVMDRGKYKVISLTEGQTLCTDVLKLQCVTFT